MPIISKNPPPDLIRDVTGVILAGGKSTRFGKNKSFIRVDGIPLIERVVTSMASVFENRLLVTNSPEEYAYLGVPMVQDLIKGIGSLGGIYTGLETISNETGFFVACDMPFLDTRLIRHMAGLISGYDAVVPRIGRMVEPLHAVYAKSSIGPLEEVIRLGLRQILELFSRVNVRYVEEDMIRSFSYDLRCFANVNRPEDLTGIMGEQDQGRPKWPKKNL
jgi:molybdopterin-guanine dinucleotide biosynthesis protein A